MLMGLVSMALNRLDLTGTWQFKEYPASARRMRDLERTHWSKANVPSSIFKCLIDAGRIEPKELYAEPEKFGWVSDTHWVFRKEFDIDTALAGCKHKHLVFEGLDTIASIWLNEKLIARTANMFIPHRFDVTGLLRRAGNRLLVKFDPPAAHAKRLMKRYTSFDSSAVIKPYRSYIRKAQYQFGWDWCPSLPGCGIWRPVRLEGIDITRFDDIHIRTVDCNARYADLKLGVKLEPRPAEELTCRLRITGPGPAGEYEMPFKTGEVFNSTVIRLKNPALWWPRGYGEQNLYRLELELNAKDRMIDRAARRFGIRRVRLNRSEDSGGRKFAIEVNGRTVFAKGANWVPPTLLPGSTTDEEYDRLLNTAADANMNMLRVWGGGYYENSRFYEVCDRLGIMLWQDFMFTCAYYPDRKWFLDEVEREGATVIKMLRNHPSLVLWCGNNEIDWCHHNRMLGKGKKFHGKAIYHKILPRLVGDLDPDRDYIPTTPFSEEDSPNAPHSGTVHKWDVWAFYAPTREYICPPENVPRFVAEFGLQSLPDIATLEQFCSAELLRIGRYALEKQNYQLDGNCRLLRYLTELFTPRESIEQFVYFSQLTQARGLKKYVEHLRAHSFRNNGVLFWQFNDVWPAISWSAVDYFQRPKAACYYAKRFFRDVLVTAVGLFHPPKANTEPALKSLSAVVVNDSDSPVTATLTCRVIDLSGKSLDQVEFPVSITPFSGSPALKLPKVFVNPDRPERSCLHLVVRRHARTIAQNLYFYLPDKYIHWPEPRITADVQQQSVNRWRLRLGSDVLTKDLQIITQPSCRLSDNFLDLIPPATTDVIMTAEQAVGHTQPAVRFRSVASSSG